MNVDRLQMLMAAHHEFVQAAGLPEVARPYSAQSNLSDIQKWIMDELKQLEAAGKQTHTTTEDDDIPF